MGEENEGKLELEAARPGKGDKMEPKRLYRSETNRMLCGVCGGIAEYFNIDPTLVRLVAAVWMLTGSGIVAYLLAAVIIPSESRL